MPEKQCTKCGISDEAGTPTFFYDYAPRRCKACITERCREYNAENRTARKAYAKKYRDKNRPPDKLPPRKKGEVRCGKCGIEDMRCFALSRPTECRPCGSARQAEWRDNNLERAREAQRQWVKTNQEHIKEYRRRYREKRWQDLSFREAEKLRAQLWREKRVARDAG